MEDHRIIDLYWHRNENAISETAAKYGSYLHSIACQILSDAQDAEECVSDTYADAWHSMPPYHPCVLSAFLGRITRRISIDAWRRRCAEKRGGEPALVLDGLAECVSGTGSAEADAERRMRVIPAPFFALWGAIELIAPCTHHVVGAD